MNVEEARLALAQAEQAEAQKKIAAVKERLERVLSFDDAEDVIQAGYDGKWVRVNDDDARRLIKSIAGVNLIRGTKGEQYLFHHQDRGLLVIAQHFSAIEPHPLYSLEELERAEKALQIKVTTFETLPVGGQS